MSVAAGGGSCAVAARHVLCFGHWRGKAEVVRLISLNVCNGGGRRICAQVDLLAAYNPDVVALQEVFASTVPVYAREFAERGYPYAANSFSQSPDPSVLTGARKYGELVVSRWPLAPRSPSLFAVPWPERILSASISTPDGACELHTTYVPHGSGHDWTKIDTLEGICSTLARHVDYPRLLCGDFNLPQVETPAGEVITWGQHKSARGGYVTERRQDGRWDRAERAMMLDLAPYDLVDAFRHLNGYSACEYSWYSQTRAGESVGYRLDHIFASLMLKPTACRYLHEIREATPRMSDHSAILLDAVFGGSTST
jgi:exonuclease III